MHKQTNPPMVGSFDGVRASSPLFLIGGAGFQPALQLAEVGGVFEASAVCCANKEFEGFGKFVNFHCWGFVWFLCHFDVVF